MPGPCTSLLREGGSLAALSSASVFRSSCRLVQGAAGSRRRTTSQFNWGDQGAARRGGGRWSRSSLAGRTLGAREREGEEALPLTPSSAPAPLFFASGPASRGPLSPGRWRCASGPASASASAGVLEGAAPAEKEKAAGKDGAAAPVSGNAIRRRFLAFFAARGHAVLPSSSLVPEDPSVLLTIAGMLQFKPIFLGLAAPEVPRATTSQKCIRTNDVENVGRTARHHTFFEMLGNFSFGDYFKEQACLWAWQLATQEFELPVERVWVSVFDEDEETLQIWRDKVGVAPERILRMGAEDNFWSSGPVGPCGPCSELYYDFHPERGTQGADLGDDSRFIEFYNLVFMQSNRRPDGSLEDLKNKNIDTGMGLERMAQILQKVPNNYETDLLFPIVETAARLAGLDYHAAQDERTKTYLKVIGDHSRAVVYLLSDGVLPSNVGRGYVLRRLIRRIVRMGRLLGIGSAQEEEGEGGQGAYLPIMARQVIALSAEVDPGVQRNAERICAELRKEELRFTLTLERGEKFLEQMLAEAEAAAAASGGVALLSGADAFLLYDTYGFPVEMTREVAEERGVEVGMAAFDLEMEGQRKRAQAAHSVVKMEVAGAAAQLDSDLPATSFLGYTSLSTESRVAALLVLGGEAGAGPSAVSEAVAGQEVEVVLEATPFYAEGGGQIGDWGMLEGQGGGGGRLRVTGTRRGGGTGDLWLHRARVEEGCIAVGEAVRAQVDVERRRSAQAHHTATHLLQAALKEVLGPDIAQAGSLVAFDRLRFDFSCPRSPTEAELQRVEALVNSWIGRAVALESSVMPLAEAKAAGAVAMFGEKYGQEVRVVSVPGISLELCGGTHVRNTADIRALKVTAESGIAAGVRRIEAVAGDAAVEYLGARDNVLKALSTALKVRAEDVPVRVTALQEELRSARSEVAELKSQLAVAAAEALAEQAVAVGPLAARVLVHRLDAVADPEGLKAAAQRLLERLGDPAAVLLASSGGESGKVSIVAAFSPQVVLRGLSAGKVAGAAAKICGGGGGGRPNFAQAGGKQPEKLAEALRAAQADISAALEG
eukprot:TRINITY_DN7358_c0_g1_i1.p1 TRINITY_DN7358_c0_g1~~TRINITY_DN7358_c0_g1_i1.p1  ORF type:complete len:1055 (-),score=319.89 TRINITY_DN7358_c0_g1_i1:465-3629(-)